MPIAVNGSGTVTGISVGGLPDGCVDTDTLAAGAATQAKRTYATGEVVQVVMGTFQNTYSGTTFADITSTSYVSYGDMFLNITPKFSDSKLIFDTNINARVDSAGGYTLYQLYDATNSVSLMDAGLSHFYNEAANAYPNTRIYLFGTSGGTTTRKIEVRVKLVSSGTLNSDYRGEPRLMTLTEVKQ